MRTVQEYHVKGKKVFIGLEDSKRTWKICARSEGEIIDQTSMPASYEVLIKYLRNSYPESEIKVMYEAGFHGFWLKKLLKSGGIECIVTPPNLVVMEKHSRVKTDRIDAMRLAKNLEKDDYRECFTPDNELLEDRQISRTLEQVKKIIISTKNQIRRFLEFHGLDTDMKAGPWTNKDYENLHGLSLTGPLAVSLNILLNNLRYMQEQEKTLKMKLKEISTKERYRNLLELFTSVCGIGEFSGIRIILELGDMRRFPTARGFISYLGLSPSEYSSGDKIQRGRITKQGNKYVRKWLVECSWSAKRKDPSLNAKYFRVRRSSGSSKKAIVATARKLALKLRHIALAQEPYCIGLMN